MGSLFFTLCALASSTALSNSGIAADAPCGSTCGAASHGSSLIQRKSALGTWAPGCVALDNNQGITDVTCEPCGNGQAWWPCNTNYCDCSGTSPEEPPPSPDGGGGGDGGCVALDNNQGISDSSCTPCGEGQTWWPCNTPYCSCSGVSPSSTSSPLPPPPPPAVSPSPPVEVVPATPVEVVPAPAPAPSPLPSPPVEVVPAPAPSGSSSGSSSGSTPIASWFSEEDFGKFFPHVDNAACTGKGFFSRDALLKAAESFPDFANTGDVTKDKLEFAAFLAHTSHETTGGWATAPGGPQSWGYCFKEERGCETGHCTGYCAAGNPCNPQNFDCTCAAGQTYQGRGPVQLSWNYNYGKFSKELYGDASILLNNPSKVATDPVLAYQSALWFWMTAQSPKPSCHDVMTGVWEPSSQDLSVGRVAGFGMVTNIINGGLECNKPTNGKVKDRVEFFRRYLGVLNVPMPSDATLYCNAMTYYR